MPTGIEEYIRIIAELNLVMPVIEESNNTVTSIAKSFIEVFQENTVLLKQLEPTVTAFQKTLPAVHGSCRLFARLLLSEYQSACYANGISPQDIRIREEITVYPLNWNISGRATAYLTEEGLKKIEDLSSVTEDEKNTACSSIDSVIRIMDENKDRLQKRDRAYVSEMAEKLHFIKTNLVRCADDLIYCFNSRAQKVREYLDSGVPH